MPPRVALLAVIAWLCAAAPPALAQFDPRPRLLITTDIGGDPDDRQSLVRLLAHSDAFRIAGLVASASGTPGETDPTPRPDLILDHIAAYGQHETTFRIHNPLAPTAASLASRVFAGNAKRGLNAVIPGIGTTPGSQAIVDAVDASSEPLHIAVWGGATELAQALADVQATRTPAQVSDFVRKLRVHAINDQDGYDAAAQGTLAWMKSQFPTMLIIDPTPAGAASNDDFRRFDSTYRGMYQNDSTNGSDTPVPLVSNDVAALNTQAWVQTHISQNHGTLGELYPDNVNQNPNTARNTQGVKEGDTPSWFSFFPNGLGDPDDPTLGGWGGRYQGTGDGTNHYQPAFDDLPDPAVTDPAARAKWTVARFRAAYQNEFANRMDWFVAENFADANHAPTPFAGIPPTAKRQRVNPGGSVFLFSDGWFDPDGDPLRFTWWLYDEAGRGDVPDALRNALANATGDSLFLSLAGVEAGSELHLILEISDHTADLPFTRYERFILQVGSRTIPEPAAAALGITVLARRYRPRV